MSPLVDNFTSAWDKFIPNGVNSLQTLTTITSLVLSPLLPLLLEFPTPNFIWGFASFFPVSPLLIASSTCIPASYKSTKVFKGIGVRFFLWVINDRSPIGDLSLWETFHVDHQHKIFIQFSLNHAPRMRTQRMDMTQEDKAQKNETWRHNNGDTKRWQTLTKHGPIVPRQTRVGLVPLTRNKIR